MKTITKSQVRKLEKAVATLEWLQNIIPESRETGRLHDSLRAAKNAGINAWNEALGLSQ